MVILEAKFHAISGISIRDHRATSTAGKNSLFPAPFTIKMALLNQVIKVEGLDQVENHLSWIRTLKIAVLLPSFFSISQSIQVIRKIKECKDKSKLSPKMLEELEKSKELGTNYQRSISNSEYNFYPEPLHFYFEVDEKQKEMLKKLLWRVNYFGKRGSFVQCLNVAEVEKIPAEAFQVMNTEKDLKEGQMIVTLLDMTEKTSWKELNIYEDTPIKNREEKWYAGSFSLVQSSNDFRIYKKVGG